MNLKLIFTVVLLVLGKKPSYWSLNAIQITTNTEIIINITITKGLSLSKTDPIQAQLRVLEQDSNVPIRINGSFIVQKNYFRSPGDDIQKIYENVKESFIEIIYKSKLLFSKIENFFKE